ncbi:uncharacterized protein LOC143806075 [Ranitomeya variabilis]|uniref:uncharacterized protein LOC143806075 n=1 Tax=Ranitomeya variabilis TaxID=490064 RepID=UPI00405646E4
MSTQSVVTSTQTTSDQSALQYWEIILFGLVAVLGVVLLAGLMCGILACFRSTTTYVVTSYPGYFTHYGWLNSTRPSLPADPEKGIELKEHQRRPSAPRGERYQQYRQSQRGQHHK